MLGITLGTIGLPIQLYSTRVLHLAIVESVLEPISGAMLIKIDSGLVLGARDPNAPSNTITQRCTLAAAQDPRECYSVRQMVCLQFANMVSLGG